MILNGVEYLTKDDVRKAMDAKKGSRIWTKIDSTFHTPELYQNICLINEYNISSIEIDEISATIFRNSFEYTNKFRFGDNKIELIYNDTEQHLTSISYNGTIIDTNNIQWLGDFPCEMDEEVDMELLRDYVSEVNRYTRLCLNRGWHMSNHIASNAKRLVFAENVPTNPDRFIQLIADTIDGLEAAEAKHNAKYTWSYQPNPRLPYFTKYNAIVFKNLNVLPYSYITYYGYIGLFNEFYEISHVGFQASDDVSDIHFIDVIKDMAILVELEEAMQTKIHDPLIEFMDNQITTLL